MVLTQSLQFHLTKLTKSCCIFFTYQLFFPVINLITPDGKSEIRFFPFYLKRLALEEWHFCMFAMHKKQEENCKMYMLSSLCKGF